MMIAIGCYANFVVNDSHPVTMSCPIVVTNDNGSASVVVAAAGIHASQDFFRSIFLDSTASCGINCSLSCHSSVCALV